MSSWDDQDERTRPSGFGGDWRGARPSFDDPMSWSFPIMRVVGITVRLHVFFIVFSLVVIAHAASVTSQGAVGVRPTLLGIAALFTIVLLHEFGHCIACRRSGGSADEILLWPLGGLATCSPPQRPRAHFWTAAGGPLVNVLFIAVLTPLIGLESNQWWGRAIPNPLDLGGMMQRADFGEDLAGWGKMFLFLLNFAAWVLLLFNLLPMFPLDGGRLLQAVLWKRLGYAASMRIACRAGIIGAVVLGVVALSVESTMLLGIAIFGGFTCYMSAKQIEHERDFLGFEPDPSELAAMEEEFEAPARKSVQSRGRTESPRQTAAEAEIDRILDKIARSGIESLSQSEREALHRATDERRGRDRGEA
jgi:Zn-dependent protease